jgi:hypothetical protein
MDISGNDIINIWEQVRRMSLFGTSFRIEEFVPPETVERWGLGRSIWFVRPHVVLFCSHIKETFGGILTINNWYWGGVFKYSGYRPPDCDVGAKESSHKRSDAVDMRSTGIGVEELSDYIERKYSLLHSRYLLTGIELGTSSWTHVDFRCTGLDYLHKIPYQ